MQFFYAQLAKEAVKKQYCNNMEQYIEYVIACGIQTIYKVIEHNRVEEYRPVVMVAGQENAPMKRGYQTTGVCIISMLLYYKCSIIEVGKAIEKRRDIQHESYQRQPEHGVGNS